MGISIENCKKFGGEVVGNVCMVDGFPMGETPNVFNFHPESQKHEIWDPDTFLKLTGWGGGPWPWGSKKVLYSKETEDYFIKKIEKREPIDVPWIDKDVDRGFAPEVIGKVTWVPNHEGRHRALACKRVESCKRIPVVIYHRKQGYYVPIPEEGEAK